MTTAAPLVSLLVVALAASAAAGTGSPAPARPTYPEGADVPRHLTAEEARYLEAHPLRALAGGGAEAPTGPLHCAAEYEPMQGILVAWEGNASWKAILARIGAEVTTTGDADFYVVADDAAEEASARTDLAAAGADPARVETLVASTDSIWMRDYGPRYVYEGGVRAIVDHTYNRPRPDDDAFPVSFGAFRNHARYEIPLIHGGGNYHLDAVRRSYATRLINNENPGLTEAEIQDLWRTYQGVETTLFDPYPRSVDSTQHLDMWMQVIADDQVMIADWPSDAGSTQDRICDDAAVLMAGRGYTVHRVPARSVNGTHYTYTNVVMVNALVLIPGYSNSQVQGHNAEALLAWQTALPGHTIVQLDAQPIVTFAGVFHCIVMHVPAPLGGAVPSAYLKSEPGCAGLLPGTVETLRWISDDDRATVDADIWLSTDGGQTYPTPVALGIPDTGSYDWTVPTLATTTARLRIDVRDADLNLGSDTSDADFAIGSASGPAPLPPAPLKMVKTDLGATATLVVPEQAAAAGYNVYEGPLGTFYTPDLNRCHRDRLDPELVLAGGTVRYRLTPGAASRWFLESASSCAGESALGLPAAPWSCGPTP